MQIINLNDIISFLNKKIYVNKNGRHEENVSEHVVYFCQPIHIKGKIIDADIKEGHIEYYSRSASGETGRYYFVNHYKKNGVKFTLSDYRLADVQSDANCEKFPNLEKIKLYTECHNKHVFTEREEAEKYINNILYNNDELPEETITVTTTTTEYNNNEMTKNSNTYII